MSLASWMHSAGECQPSSQERRSPAARSSRAATRSNICLPADKLVLVPSGLDPAEAVCLVVNYLTAHVMHRTARVRSGDRILVHGAAGGVGTALLELGTLAELEMYGTTSRHKSRARVRAGSHPDRLTYRTEDFVARIGALIGDGVDAVFDPIGSARQLWRSYRSLRDGGRLVWFGIATTASQGIRIIPLSVVTRAALALIPDGKKALMPPDVDTYVRDDLPACSSYWQRARSRRFLRTESRWSRPPVPTNCSSAADAPGRWCS